MRACSVWRLVRCDDSDDGDDPDDSVEKVVLELETTRDGSDDEV